MVRLMLKNRDSIASSKPLQLRNAASASTLGSSVPPVAFKDLVNSVDQFLCEAIQNLCERISDDYHSFTSRFSCVLSR
ncbi:hypothetical protein DCAR_0728589 [Daucus carota subsp. sativus]|uniref:Uncharacterized protein n=1 Tax=Daucus carota subsp. sativus TaxID=79200 RepID=A0A164TPI3_DAUCS|nr:hypothetical protein DCAR_0728589 [Daucus carota subsp. sativus]